MDVRFENMDKGRENNPLEKKSLKPDKMYMLFNSSIFIRWYI